MSAHNQTGVALATMLAGAAMFIGALPLIYHKVPRNRFFGIRLGDALTSERRWYDINAYGGRAAARWSWPIVITGLIGLLLPSQFASIYVPTATVIALLIALIPAIQTIRWIHMTRTDLTNRSSQPLTGAITRFPR
jgi:hypothetical protein